MGFTPSEQLRLDPEEMHKKLKEMESFDELHSLIMDQSKSRRQRLDELARLFGLKLLPRIPTDTRVASSETNAEDARVATVIEREYGETFSMVLSLIRDEEKGRLANTSQPEAQPSLAPEPVSELASSARPINRPTLQKQLFD